MQGLQFFYVSDSGNTIRLLLRCTLVLNIRYSAMAVGLTVALFALRFSPQKKYK